MSTSPGCVSNAVVFRQLEDHTTGWGEQGAARARAAAVCAECPLARQCLYDAVVRFDVAGFVAGTTPQERRAIRARAGVRVESENFDTAAGVTAGGRPVDRDEVLRLRRVNPDETLEQLAQRLGCSTSTVKRHLRKVRAGATIERPARRVPTQDDVVAAARAVLGQRLAPAA